MSDLACTGKAPQLALLFPGQGSQGPRMLEALNAALPGFAEARARLNAMLGTLDGKTIEAWIAQGSAADLKRTDVAQAALCLVERALLEALTALGVQARFAIGHSFGELVALSAAQMLDAQSLCRLSRARGTCMAQATQQASGMLAVRANLTRVRGLLVEGEELWIANDNAPDQLVVAGSEAALSAFADRAKQARIATVRLQTAAAFHTPLMDSARSVFAAALSKTRFAPAGACQVIGNVTAQPYPHAEREVAQLLAAQLTSPVRFRESIEAAYEAGARVFLELGSGHVLSDLVSKILGDRPHQTLYVDPGDADAGIHLAEVLGQVRTLGTQQGRPSRCATHTSHFFESNRLAVEAFFAQQSLLVERLGPGSSDRMGLFREIVQTNREMLRDFLATQQAALGPTLPLPGSPRTLLPLDTQAKRPESPAAPRPVSRDRASEPGDKVSAVEAWLCQAISELTGFPRELVKPTSELENELGLDSITLLEVFTKLIDAFPELSGRGAEIRKARSIAEAARRLLGTEASLEAASIPAVLPSTAPPPPVGLPFEATSPLARTLAELLGMGLGRALNDADLERDFGKELGFDAFSRRELVQRLVSVYPDLDVAGRELAFAATPRELLTLCEGVLGQGETDGVERFVQVKEPLTLSATREKQPVLWVVGPASKHRELVLKTLSARELEHEVVDVTAAPGEQSLALHKLKTSESRPSLLFVTSEADEASPECWFRLVKLLDELGAPARLSVLGTSGVGHAVVCGLGRGLAHEWKQTKVRALTVAGVLDAERCARALEALLEGETELDLHLEGAGLSRAVLRKAPLADRPNDLSRLPSHAHVLCLGGGDGITARVAEMLAKRAQCKISAIGRTLMPLSDPYPDAQSDTALRAVLREELERDLGSLDPKTMAQRVSSRVRFVQRERSLLRTKARIEALGASFAYASADARDKASLARAIEQLKLAHGPIQGFVHGAGVIEDAPLSRKTEDSFKRVLETKWKTALHARALLSEEPLSFAFLFSSLTAWTGNVGQVDYIAGNQALDALAEEWNMDAPYPVRSLAFSVWHESGLAPGWAKALIAQDRQGGISDAEGVELVWDELTRGDKTSSWTLLAPRAAFDFIERGGLTAGEGAYG